jgi:putative membrane protein
MDWNLISEKLMLPLVDTVIFGFVGVLMCTLFFVIVVRVCPFSIRKEIEEDQNISLGLIIGAAIIGIAMIISASIRG